MFYKTQAGDSSFTISTNENLNTWVLVWVHIYQDFLIDYFFLCNFHITLQIKENYVSKYTLCKKL